MRGHSETGRDVAGVAAQPLWRRRLRIDLRACLSLLAEGTIGAAIDVRLEAPTCQQGERTRSERSHAPHYATHARSPECRRQHSGRPVPTIANNDREVIWASTRMSSVAHRGRKRHAGNARGLYLPQERHEKERVRAEVATPPVARDAAARAG